MNNFLFLFYMYRILNYNSFLLLIVPFLPKYSKSLECANACTLLCVCHRGRLERGWACERSKWEGELCLWEQDDPCDLSCPSLCFPHCLTWAQLYPHHHIHKGLHLQTSPSLWFIAQWRALCLLTLCCHLQMVSDVYLFYPTRLLRICWPRVLLKNWL